MLKINTILDKYTRQLSLSVQDFDNLVKEWLLYKNKFPLKDKLRVSEIDYSNDKHIIDKFFSNFSACSEDNIIGLATYDRYILTIIDFLKKQLKDYSCLVYVSFHETPSEDVINKLCKLLKKQNYFILYLVSDSGKKLLFYN